ncbi:MAG: PAS domain S-box protein, partial [Bacteroidota bacterium]|nr:PAS domain S-box protein [Bacteroidota bacterium]
MGDRFRFAFDSTDRKRDERALDIMLYGIEHAHLGIFQIAEDATILYVNRYGATSLGYAPEELTGMSLFDIDPSFDDASFAADRKAARAQGASIITTTYRRRDGSTFPVEVTAHYFQFDGMSYSYSFVKDIGDRLEAERALRENEALQRALIDAAPVAIVSLDREGRVIKWNGAAERIFGWTEEEVRGHLLPIVTPEQREEFTALRERIWSGERFSNLELQLVRKDGSPIIVHLSTAPVRAEDGTIRGIISVLDDITDAKRNEMEITRLNAELEQRVRDRTAELEHSNRELEHSNEELEAFSNSVSHDLRAPLRHINGYIDLLQQRFAAELPKQAQHYLDTVAEATREMGALIDDLLQFSRTSRKKLQRERVDMDALVAEVRADLMEAEDVGREIRWQVDSLPVVEGDRSLLALVWINLLANALKFTGKNEVTHITVTCRQEARAHVFTVTDDGVG